MKLAIINGSPRGKKSNSYRITGWMTAAMSPEHKTINVFASDKDTREGSLESFSDCDVFLMIFPLYTDAMPGITKEYMERMEEEKELFKNKPIYFIIHSGFPESSQSTNVEKYTKYFAKLMGMKYSGGIRMGGSESLQVAPDKYLRKKREAFEVLAGNIERLEPFDPDSSAYLSKERKIGAVLKFIFKLTNLNNMYWDNTMKKNGVYDNRFARPYSE
jgi:multimeric flavodoxin WrbA